MPINNSIKRSVISYENLSQELLDAFKEKYPHGYADYLSDIIKVDKPDGSYFHAVSLEVPGAIYLVKIKVHEDNLDDIEGSLFKDDNDDSQDGDSTDSDFPVNDDDMSAGADDAADSDSED